MLEPTRSPFNPILKPDPANPWEARAAFNGSIVHDETGFHLLYRALSFDQDHEGRRLSLSTIGIADSSDGVHFGQRRQLIKPDIDFDRYGCEDPRVTKIDNEYFVFYTGLSDYPFYPHAIKTSVAIFSDLNKPPQKHLVTPFNSKAMVLFPEKINGKYMALLTANTDIPPSQIALAQFEKKEDIYSQIYWKKWYETLSHHVLPLRRINSDQIEIGAVPIKIDVGWLLIYSHIQHYYNDKTRIFGIEAAILDMNNPQKIIARTDRPILIPTQEYELSGMIPKVVFPSGATANGDELSLYYGASDTTCCLANLSISALLKEMRFQSPVALKVTRPILEPILIPDPAHEWESGAVFNPAAFELNGDIHLLYRGMGADNTSVIGHAKSRDGIHDWQKEDLPVYVPKLDFESKRNPGGGSGCEDPRVTRIDDTYYMCYTAYDGVSPPRVALTSLSVSDFLKGNYSWKKPVLISPPDTDDKDAAIFPEKIGGKFVVVHRIQNSIMIDRVDSLDFDGTKFLESFMCIPPRGNLWDSEKIGLCTPPIKTSSGWVLLYHGVSILSHQYRVGAMLLDLENPVKVLARTPWPILEPEMKYEKEGVVGNVAFPCGSVLRNDTLFIYYGGADKVVCVATIEFSRLMTYLLDVRNG